MSKKVTNKQVKSSHAKAIQFLDDKVAIEKSKLTKDQLKKMEDSAFDLFKALEFCQSVIKSQGMFDMSEQIAYDKADRALQKARL